MDGDRLLYCEHLCFEISHPLVAFQQIAFQQDDTSLSYWHAEKQCTHLQDDLSPIYLHSLSEMIALPLMPQARGNTSVQCSDVDTKTE